MTYRLDGNISRITISPSGVTTELWRHTCFEAFIRVEGQAEYHEFNFAPSGEWTAYAFRDYRDGGPVTNETMRPRIALRSTSGRLEFDAVIRLDSLSATHRSAPLRIGLAAIIEATDGFSYWALRHRGDKPDFHDADGFTLLLEAPSPEC